MTECDYPVVSEDPQVQRDYVALRERGESHNFAAILAKRSPPGARSDREFLKGHCNGSQFDGMEHLGDFYAAQARRAGVDPKGKVYLSGLAERPGDPRAWVSGRGDVERVLDERGWGCEGDITRKVQKVGEPQNVGVAEDIVRDKVEEILTQVPDPHMVDTADLSEQVREKIKPYWVKE
jgi:hypothetical protein